MIVTHKIKMDLTRRDPQPCIDVVQDDRYSRKIQISLYVNGIPFVLPEGSRARICYCKEDGVGGEYDTMPDNSEAWEIAENRVTVKLAPQVCNVPGNTSLTVVLLRGNVLLHCFACQLRVQPVSSPQMESRAYENIKSAEQADWNAREYESGHVLNRTHWVERGMIEPVFDGNMAGKEVISFGEGAYAVWMSPEYVTVSDMLHATMVFDNAGTEASQTLTEDMVVDAQYVFGVSGALVLMGSDPVVLSLAADTQIEGVVLRAGTWFGFMPGVFYPKSLSCLHAYEGEVVHKLDRKFLPDNIGGGGYFTVTLTASGDDAFSADKTVAELDEAYSNGQILTCFYEGAGANLQLAYALPSQAYLFSGVPVGLEEGTLKTAMAVVALMDGDSYVYYGETEGVRKEDLPTSLKCPAKITFRNTLASVVRPNVTTATFAHHYYDGSANIWIFGIPNPYSLKITGAVTAAYDGNEEVSIEIPAGLPEVSANDNGAFLRVADGAWAAVAVTNAEEVGF